MRITTTLFVVLLACSVFAQDKAPSPGPDPTLSAAVAEGPAAKAGVQGANETAHAPAASLDRSDTLDQPPNPPHNNATVSGKSPAATAAAAATLGAASINVNAGKNSSAPSPSSDEKPAALTAASIQKPSFVAAAADRTGPSGKGPETPAVDNGATKGDGAMKGDDAMKGDGAMKGSSVDDPSKDDRNAPKPKAPDSKAPNSKSPDSKSPDSKSPDSKSPDSKSPDSKSPNPKSPDSKSPNPKSPDSKGPNPKSPDSKGPDSKGPKDPKSPDSKGPRDPKGPDSKGPDSKGPRDPKAPGSKSPKDPKTPDRPKGDAPPGLNGCRSFCRRREIRNLSPDERSAFFSTVKQIMNGASPTTYDGMVKWHIDAQQFAHSTAYFLPWHRAYLREFELALQDVDSGICVPYWNWSVDSQAPELSPIMGDDFYGGNGGTDGCVVNGQFNGWNPYYPEPHCLSRSYIYGDKLGAYHSIEGINRIVTSSSDYDTFRTRLETLAHPSVHNSVGGDISRMWSPNDPLFFAHHGYVDYIWTQWQSRHGRSFGGPAANGGGVRVDDVLQFLPQGRYTVKTVLSTTDLCYQYLDMDSAALGDAKLPAASVSARPKSKMPDRVSVVKVPDGEGRFSSKDRSNLNIVRFPDAAPEDWLRNNGHDVSKVRGYESDYRSMYANLNRIQGYISPCALWNRPSLTKHIIAAKTPVYADVNGYGRVEVDYAAEESAVDPFQAMSDIKVRVQMCSPEVELPPEACSSDLEKLVGKSAFAGAGALKTVSDSSELNAASQRSVLGSSGWLVAVLLCGTTYLYY